MKKKSTSTDSKNIQHITAGDKIISQRVKDAATKVESNFILSQTENYEYYAPYTWNKIKSDITRMRTLVSDFDPSNQGFFGGPSESKVLKSIRQPQSSMDRAQQSKALVNNFLAQQLADIRYL